MAVFLGHARIIPSGYSAFGVSIFVVLSGFLLANSYNNKAIEIGLNTQCHFAWNHVKNLYPLHIVCLIGMLPFYDFSIQTITKVILNILLLQSWIPSIPVSQSMNGVAWYLSTCLFFYFMFPFLWSCCTALKSKRCKYAAIFVWLGMLLTRYLTFRIKGLDGTFATWFYYVFPFYRLGEFFIGCCMGYVFFNSTHHNMTKLDFRNAIDSKHHCRMGGSLFSILEILGVTAFLTVGYLQSRKFDTDFLNILFTSTWIDLPISIVLITLFWMHKGTVTNLLTNGITVTIGNLSGYLFLTHYVCINLSNSACRKLGVANTYAFVLSVVLSVLSVCFYKVIRKRL